MKIYVKTHNFLYDCAISKSTGGKCMYMYKHIVILLIKKVKSKKNEHKNSCPGNGYCKEETIKDNNSDHYNLDPSMNQERECEL